LLLIFNGILLNFIDLLIFEKVKIKKSKENEENEQNNSKSKSEKNEEIMDFGIEMQGNNSSSYIKLIIFLIYFKLNYKLFSSI
jgi:hypothetical protein